MTLPAVLVGGYGVIAAATMAYVWWEWLTADAAPKGWYKATGLLALAGAFWPLTLTVFAYMTVYNRGHAAGVRFGATKVMAWAQEKIAKLEADR